MDYVIAALLFGILTALALGGWWARREYLDMVAEVRDTVASAFATGPDGAPCPAQRVLSGVGASLAADVKASISGALMGQASAMSKQLQAIEADVAMDGAEAQSPILSLLTSISPSLRKRLAKNPFAALAAGALAGKLGGIGPPGSAIAKSNGQNGHKSMGLSVP